MLHVIDLNGVTHPVNNITQIERTRKVNGETTISFNGIPDPKYPESWKALDNEAKLNFKNEPFIIKGVTRGNIGETEAKKLEAEHTFFNNLINAQQYAVHTGSQTFTAALDRVFAPTVYNYVINGEFRAQSFDNFGRENCLALFLKVLERYGAEFRVSGNTVYLYNQIGAHTGFQWRYQHNIKSLSEDKNSRGLSTVIRGYFGKPNDEGVYPMEMEHRSSPEKIAKFGELHADSYTNENVTDETTALRLLDERLNDEPQLSQTIDFADLQAAGYDQGRPNEGDWGYIIYEPMDIRVEARIVEVNEVFRWINDEWTPVKTTVTLSNIRQTQTEKNTRFAKTSKQLDRLTSGVDSMPLSSMDIAVRNMTRLMQNASTELQFPESGGMLAVSKHDSNKMVIYNSEGIFFSKDGGATPYAGMTGDGIVADAINVGTLRGILVEAVEIHGSYMEGTEIVGGEFFSGTEPNSYTRIRDNYVENRGVFTRTWRGSTETHDVTWKLANGYFRVENPEKERALSFLDDGISTFADGDGGGSSSGTMEFFSRRFSDVNGLTMYSSGTFGVDASEIVMQSIFSQTIESNESQIYFRPNRTNRPGNNAFALSVLDETAEHLTDGFLAYGSTANGYASGFRFSKRAAEPIIWAVDGNLARYGNTKIGAGYFMGYMAMSHTGENFYLGSTSEIRSVRATDYQAGTITYIDHRAANFLNGSSIAYKTDFRKPEISGLHVINKLAVMDYVLIKDIEEGNYANRQLGVISELSPEIATNDGKAINLYKGLSYNILATQELSVDVTKNKNDIAGIYDVLGALIEDVRQLKEMESA